MVMIQTVKQSAEFKTLLNDNEINKILFSGRFGTGKTTFLKDFFQNNTNYTPIFLYPINYSIANNEDIFEYIKYDILIKLLEWDDIESYITDISNTIATQVLFLHNPKEFILKLVESYSKVFSITEKFDAFISGTKVLKEELDKYKESKQIDSFLQELTKKNGSLFERNLITSIITSIIQRWKEENPEKKICLVIDDTDRIDPEHIFRIMNVFAAHNDIEDESKNKFGFEKIITVCDVNNIQNIFLTRYGANTDFSGYISKFHSKSIFHFDFSKEIIEQIDTIFNEYRVGDYSFISNYNFFYEGTFKPVVSELIQHNLITIRRIKQVFNNDEFKYINNQRYYYNKVLYNDGAEYILWLYLVLKDIFNGTENMYDILEKMNNLNPFYSIVEGRSYNVDVKLEILSNVIYLVERKKLEQEKEEQIFTYKMNSDLSVQYKCKNSMHNAQIEFTHDFKDINIPFWNILISGFRVLDNIIQHPIRG